ncbi:MAG TPA: class I tRNA ligase family protein, partial [Candidatus Eisenbacteria bacterium]
REGLGVVCPVDEAGRFTAGAEPFVGRPVLDERDDRGRVVNSVNADITAWLAERGRLLASSRLTHSYPHCWRCRQPVIFRATDQWFMIIDHAGHRARSLELIDRAVRWEPPASQNRIRESVRLRPDWCLSRQRAWGVGIPAVYCEACSEPLLDPAVMRRAAELTRGGDGRPAPGSDVWYERPVEDFLPAGFTCPKCGKPGPFRKETDILDVWFDSGCTHRALQAIHPGFREAWARARREGGRIAYFEGPDQHRGWFNSSLMVSAGLDGTAPYTDVLTHGWVLDEGGRAMHKSLGNVISPQDIIAKYGADVVRWWALATDWRTDVRVGEKEVLPHVADAYRKVRNTFRFLLGNLGDFTPAQARPDAELTRVDRAFSGALAAGLARMRREYEALQFHRALSVLLDLCTVDLSAVFLDAAKDRLYTLAPDDPQRRSAQTVLWRALHDLAIASSPALAFTAEEAWQHHPSLTAEHESVHFALWPEPRPGGAAEEAADWDLLHRLRDAVNAAIEPRRASQELSTTAEAEVEITAAPALAARLAPYAGELAGFLLVARASLRPASPGGTAEFEVAVAKTAWPRCERCWTYRADVGSDAGAPGLCARCVRALAARGAAAR